tara:strand:- start:627 stop:830 length:204 start_codon:yes stop_codon:yes gene_type:complete
MLLLLAAVLVVSLIMLVVEVLVDIEQVQHQSEHIQFLQLFKLVLEPQHNKHERRRGLMEPHHILEHQ